MKVPDIETVLKALAELGFWKHSPFPESEMFRIELRRACRQRGIKVRTGFSHGHLFAVTPDGLPAEEPWRGAAEHFQGSEVKADLMRAAIDAAYSASGTVHYQDSDGTE